MMTANEDIGRLRRKGWAFNVERFCTKLSRYTSISLLVKFLKRERQGGIFALSKCETREAITSFMKRMMLVYSFFRMFIQLYKQANLLV